MASHRLQLLMTPAQSECSCLSLFISSSSYLIKTWSKLLNLLPPVLLCRAAGECNHPANAIPMQWMKGEESQIVKINELNLNLWKIKFHLHSLPLPPLLLDIIGDEWRDAEYQIVFLEIRDTRRRSKENKYSKYSIHSARGSLSLDPSK